MPFSVKPFIVAFLTFIVAFGLAAALAALTALTQNDFSWWYQFFKNLPMFIAGMLAAGLFCGCIISYWLGALAGSKQVSPPTPTPSPNTPSDRSEG
jgi:hypothetical protein